MEVVIVGIVVAILSVAVTIFVLKKINKASNSAMCLILILLFLYSKTQTATPSRSSVTSNETCDAYDPRG